MAVLAAPPPINATGNGAPGPSATVLHYCHHSVGLGHLVRSLAVAEALAQRFRIVLCSGGLVPAGLPLPSGIELVELPPITAAPGGGLQSADPMLTLDAAWDRRRALLLSLYRELRPAALMIELFPFGRAKFARELLPLLDMARSDRRPVKTISSVRDLLVTNKRDQQAHDDLAAARLSHYFDAVIVHADERFARLQDTFRPSLSARTPVLYSGFVAPGAAALPRGLSRRTEVLVSAGGGLHGAPLLRVAAEAHQKHFARRGLTTKLVTGPFLPAGEATRLRQLAARRAGLIVEDFIPDMCAEMAGAAVSVSRGGYNTMIDVLRSGVPSVVVPYDDAGDEEQSERARRLERLGVLKVLPGAALNADRLGAAVLDAIRAQPLHPTLDLSGAERTASLVSELIAGVAATGGQQNHAEPALASPAAS
jgi:predicted glycosyltransferase